MTLPNPLRECQMLLWVDLQWVWGHGARLIKGTNSRNPKTEPTCSHWFPLVICPKYLALNTFPPAPPSIWVVRFFYFCHGKNKLLFWEHVGFKPLTVSALSTWKRRSTACVPEGLACVSVHVQPGWQGGTIPPGSSCWCTEWPQLPRHRARDPIPALK